MGGQYDGALVVRVAARAVDRRATEAALTAVALVTGATSRSEVVEVAGGAEDVLRALLAR